MSTTSLPKKIPTRRPGFPRTGPVNDHQMTFCRALVSGKIALEAYRIAYPRSVTWKDQHVRENASKLLASPNVKAFMKELHAEANALSIITAQEIVQETRRLALASPVGIVNNRGRLKKLHELDADTAASVASYEIDQFGKIKYRFWDKNTAIERAAKMLGLFEKDNLQKTSPLQTLMDTLGGNVWRPTEIAAQPDGDDDEGEG